MGTRIAQGARLLVLGLVLLALALGFELLWLARNPTADGGMVLAIGRLGLRVELSRPAFEAFALAAGMLALGCVAWAYFAARGALRVPGGVSWGRLALAAALFLACALPLNRLIGWADGKLVRLAHYNADWYRRSFFRELSLVSARRLFWLAAVLVLGAWLLKRHGGSWCARLSRALEAVVRAPRRLVLALAAALFLTLALAYTFWVTRGLPDYADAHGYMFQARCMAAGHLTSPLPADQDFFNPWHCPHPTDMGIIFVGNRWLFCGLPFGLHPVHEAGPEGIPA